MPGIGGTKSAARALLEAEGLIKARKQGRPPRLPNPKELLNRMGSITRQIIDVDAENVNLDLAQRVLLLLGAATIEQGLADPKIKVEQRMDWALRSPSFISKMGELKTKEEEKAMPRTKALVDKEANAIKDRIKALKAELEKPTPSPEAVSTLVAEAEPPAAGAE